MKKLSLLTLTWVTSMEGMLIALWLMLSPSREPGPVFGFTWLRFAMILTAVSLTAVCVSAGVWLTRKPDIASIIEQKLEQAGHFILGAALLTIIFTFAFCIAGFGGNWVRLGNIGSYVQRGLPLLVWSVLVILQVQVWLVINGHSKSSDLRAVDLISFLLSSGLMVFILIDIVWRGNGINLVELKNFSQTKLIPNFWWVIIIFSGGLVLYKYRKTLPACMVFIFVVVWFIYQFTGFIGRWYFRTPEQAYFPYLAESFLQGRLYLTNPISLVELTPMDGNWYVPYPPLAAILMMPMVALWGAQNVNSSNFSIFFAALAVSLVFAILEKISERGWTKLNTKGNLWLAALFCLSTPLWQIAISGEVWYINQVLTLTFVAGSILLVVMDAPAILAGLCLGLAVLARPPIALTGIFLFSLYWQIHQDENGKIKFAQWVKWGLAAIAPVALIVVSFLFYNQARFGSYFDFGYVNMNIGEPARTDVRTYGQFNLRYLWRNVSLMFLGFPYWKNECSFWTVNVDGASMFVATPAVLYVFGSFRKKIWVAGAWVTSLLLLIPLMLYFTTGTFQFGYRYVMDLMIPLIMLIAVAIPTEKMPLHARIVILAGILINYWGVWWFYRHWCR